MPAPNRNPPLTPFRSVRSSPAVVLRSQSYHSGVGQSATDGGGGADDDAGDCDGSGAGGEAAHKRWTLISTESSDDDDQPRY